MPCYICLEGGKMVKDKGCGCKGSIEIHSACFQEWIYNTENPFNCPVCKTDYKASFLSSFMSIEDMLTRGFSEEEEPEEFFYQSHGVPVTQIDGMIYFESDEHVSIYQHSCKMEKKSIRLYHENKMKSLKRAVNPPSNLKRSRFFKR